MKLVNLEEIDLSKLPLNLCNERPIEVNALFNIVEAVINNLTSLLDVGCHWSHAYYAQELKWRIKDSATYDGVDILEDQITASILDNYYQSNICALPRKKYDIVTCISTIEHSGISTYKMANYHDEQQRVFANLVEFAQNYIFMTFPFGKDDLYPNEYANITEDQLMIFDAFAETKGFGQQYKEFYFSEFPQGRIPYKQIIREEAAYKPMMKDKGIQCVGVCLWSKHAI